jgi:hypothetical protein
MWMKHKGETFNPPCSTATVGSVRRCLSGESPRIVDAPIEVDVYDGELCAVITDQTFRIDDYK